MTCPGCGSTATASYCADCGQRQGERVLSMGTLLREVLEDQFSVNATLPRTLKALFFQPGMLTAEYLRLKISPYVPPFRLYLVASLLFFVVLAFRARQPIELTDTDRAEIVRQMQNARDTAAVRAARGDTVRVVTFGITIPLEGDNWADSVDVSLGNERLNRAVHERLLQLRGLPPEEALNVIFRELVQQAPKAMFILLPLHALLLKLLYLRTGSVYVGHFIFSLHVHAFAFAAFLIAAVLPFAGIIGGIVFLWLLAYQWIALRRVYAQGVLVTTAKWTALSLVYFLLVGVAVVALFALAILAQ